jgi:hypothetical protein
MTHPYDADVRVHFLYYEKNVPIVPFFLHSPFYTLGMSLYERGMLLDARLLQIECEKGIW